MISGFGRLTQSAYCERWRTAMSRWLTDRDRHCLVNSTSRLLSSLAMHDHSSMEIASHARRTSNR